MLGYEKVLAADVSTAFEWGGVAGAVTVGLLSDRLARRGVPRVAIALACLVGLAGAFWIYLGAGGGVLANVLGLALIGFLLFGPDSLISGAAAQDARRRPQARRRSRRGSSTGSARWGRSSPRRRSPAA